LTVTTIRAVADANDVPPPRRAPSDAWATNGGGRRDGLYFVSFQRSPKVVANILTTKRMDGAAELAGGDDGSPSIRLMTLAERWALRRSACRRGFPRGRRSSAEPIGA
jgi:hypothetical protein